MDYICRPTSTDFREDNPNRFFSSRVRTNRQTDTLTPLNILLTRVGYRGVGSVGGATVAVGVWADWECSDTGDHSRQRCASPQATTDRRVIAVIIVSTAAAAAVKR